jgi:hypothetical protein
MKGQSFLRRPGPTKGCRAIDYDDDDDDDDDDDVCVCVCVGSIFINSEKP